MQCRYGTAARRSFALRQAQDDKPSARGVYPERTAKQCSRRAQDDKRSHVPNPSPMLSKIFGFFAVFLALFAPRFNGRSTMRATWRAATASRWDRSCGRRWASRGLRTASSRASDPIPIRRSLPLIRSRCRSAQGRSNPATSFGRFTCSGSIPVPDQVRPGEQIHVRLVVHDATGSDNYDAYVQPGQKLDFTEEFGREFAFTFLEQPVADIGSDRRDEGAGRET